MFKRLIVGALVFGMAGHAPPAFAQVICMPRDLVAKDLSGRYGEAPVVTALSDGARVVEFWGKPDGGSWTLLVTTAEGMSCVLGSGPHWMPMPQTPPPPTDSAG